MYTEESMTRLEELSLQRRDLLKAIHDILASGQEAEIEGMRLKRVSLTQARAMLNDIEREIAVLERHDAGKTRPRIKVVVPV